MQIYAKILQSFKKSYLPNPNTYLNSVNGFLFFTKFLTQKNPESGMLPPLFEI